jgi:hypothetical protein
MAPAECRRQRIPALVTPEEIGGVPILEALGAGKRERLSQSTADIRLVRVHGADLTARDLAELRAAV